MIYVITMLYVSFEICSVAYTPWTVLHLIVCILQHGFYVYMTILTPQPPLSLLLSSQQFSTFCLLHLAGEGTTKITEAHQDQLLQLHWQFISSSVHTSIAIFHSRSSSSKLAIPDNKGTPHSRANIKIPLRHTNFSKNTPGHLLESTKSPQYAINLPSRIIKTS